MRNLQVRIIRFRRTQSEPYYCYALNDKATLEIGDYYYNRELGAFYAIQRVLHKSQVNVSFPKIEATDNPDYELPALPQSLVKQLTESREKSLTTYLRLP